MPFARYRLELLSPLHIGAGRAGMLDRTLRYIPGGVLAQALAAVLGVADGGERRHFQGALEWVRDQLRCGPAFLETPTGEVLLPGRDEARIERIAIGGQNHVTLDPGRASAVDGGLFETEMILDRPVDGGPSAGRFQLVGGLWLTSPGAEYAGQPLTHWLDRCWLGGETKIGLGRLRLSDYQTDAQAYPGLGPVTDRGLWREAGERLPGPALEGVTGVVRAPWTRRVFDAEQGFGRRFTEPRLVYLHGTVCTAGPFLPSDAFDTLGCWTPA